MTSRPSSPAASEDAVNQRELVVSLRLRARTAMIEDAIACGLMERAATVIERSLASPVSYGGAETKGVEITARQQTPIVADYDERFLVAHVNRAGTQVGIDHPCDAVWSDVMVAHVALRDYINERIERQDKCPFKAKALAQSTASSTAQQGATDAGR